MPAAGGLRAANREYAYNAEDPSQILGYLDRALVSPEDGQQFEHSRKHLFTNCIAVEKST